VNPICPYCRTELEEQPLECPGCGTPHHSECFAENGGCTVFGCSAAPAAEAKISVTGTELDNPQQFSRQPSVAPSTPSPRSTSGWLGTNSVLGSISSFETANRPAQDNAPASTPPPPQVAGTGVAPPPAPPTRGVYAPLRPIDLFPPATPPKKRVVFVLLGIFLGMFGAHNFYAGYIKKAVIQLCISVLTCFYAAIASWIWAIVEACTIKNTADGQEFV
jgi:TM2 domain-containing membrane protein YozV